MKIKTPPLTWKDLVDGIEIEIPESEKVVSKFRADGLVDVFNRKVTIYNDIPKNAIEERRFDRYVINECSVQGGIVHEADGTISNIVNATTIITRDIKNYKSLLDYVKIPVDQRDNFFTVNIGDFIVLDEVEDIVTTASEFSQLQTKYKGVGVKVTNVSVNIFGMSVDNITITNT